MTVETLITIVTVAWLLGLFTIRDIVSGIKEFKQIRQEIATDTEVKTKVKKQWTKDDITNALSKMDKNELKKRLDDGKYSGEWKKIAEELLTKDKSDV